ncbi:MAG: type II toxin-antitoxin system VapC family toxin [Phycisphaerales bacterium]
MTHAFADTSFYLALLRPDDQDHAAAHEAAADGRTRVTTTEFVLCELGNALCASDHRRLFGRLVDRLRTDPRVAIVQATPEVFETGLALFRSFPDKDWSIVDCISFVVMRRLRIRDALTADRHFEQPGFRALLRRGRRPRA